MTFNKDLRRHEYVTYLAHSQQTFTFITDIKQRHSRKRKIIVKPRQDMIEINAGIKVFISKFRRNFNKTESVFKGWFEDSKNGQKLAIKHDIALINLVKFIPNKKEVRRHFSPWMDAVVKLLTEKYYLKMKNFYLANITGQAYEFITGYQFFDLCKMVLYSPHFEDRYF